MVTKMLSVVVGALVLSATFWQSEARTYSNSWAVSVKGGSSAADQLASKYGFINKGQVGILKDMYHFVMPEDRKLGKRSISGLPIHHLTEALEKESNVGYVKQQELKHMIKKGYSVPSDPEWRSQWQLLNTGQLNGTEVNDLRVERAWLQRLTGCGSVVAIVDDGVEYTHSDLRSNYDSSLQLDALDDDGDPFPIINEDGVRESHGTNCAGIVAMTKNNSHCGVGVAYNSQITGIRVLGGRTTDIAEASALGHQLDKIHISSNSWGPSDNGRTVEGPGDLTARVLESATRVGRQGKGTIYLFAAGNGGDSDDSCAADGYASSIYTIGIGAAGSDGEQPEYDELCAGKMAVTFVDNLYQLRDTNISAVITTDTANTCINSFFGTSAATPLAAGIIALVLEANDNLTWRDVQYLIVYTANRDILKNGEWTTNGATPPLNVSYKFGFGVLDAEAMVTRAKHWINVPEQQSDTVQFTPSTGMARPNNTFGATLNYASSSIGFIEHVVVTLSTSFPDAADYNYYSNEENGPVDTLDSGPYRGNIWVELTSPSGTTSIIMPYRIYDVTTSSFYNFPLTSVHFWGEDPRGTWRLTLRNRNSFENATISVTVHSISFYGTSETPQSVSRIPAQCDPRCDASRGCAAAGTQYCDACAVLRNAATLECIDACPQGFIQRSGYCYDDTVPEVGCVRGGAQVVRSMSLLMLSLLTVVGWLSIRSIS